MNKLIAKIIPALILSILIFSISGTVSAYNKPAPLVKPVMVKEFGFYENFTAVGQVKSENSRTYHAKVNGVVDFIEIVQGKNVAKGDLLITIDNDLAEAIKLKAEAVFESAKSTYERDLSLLAKKFISQEVSNKSKVDLETAKVDLENATSQYDNMIIKAPFNGYVGVVHAQVGDDIKKDDYLFSLVASGNKTIFVNLPESLYNKVSDQSLVSVLNHLNKKENGRIEAISNYLNDNGTLTAKLSFAPETKLLHGSYVETEITYDQHLGLALPEKTVLKNNQGNFVYKIAADNTVQQIYVKTGTRTEDIIEIISDEIKKGDLVVLEGLTKVSAGVVVKIIEKTPDAN